MFHLREGNLFDSEVHEDSGLYLRELQGEFLSSRERTGISKRNGTGIPGVSEEILPHHETRDALQGSREQDASTENIFPENIFRKDVSSKTPRPGTLVHVSCGSTTQKGGHVMSKPNGITEEKLEKQLAEALEKAIGLILDMSIRKITVPYDTIARWENLIRYAREEGDYE